MTAQEFLEFWQQSGLTQKQLAEALGCSQSAISEWKDGKRKIPRKVLIIIRLRELSKNYPSSDVVDGKQAKAIEEN